MFEIINFVIPDPQIFFWIAASVVDASGGNPNDSKTLLANSSSTFSIKASLFFSNCPKSLPKNPPYSPILCNWVFDKFILADEPFEKALRSLETCVLLGNNLWGKLFLVLESPIIFNITILKEDQFHN